MKENRELLCTEIPQCTRVAWDPFLDPVVSLAWLPRRTHSNAALTDAK